MGTIRGSQKAILNLKLSDNSELELECPVKNILFDRVVLDVTKEILNYAEYLEEGAEFPVKIFTSSGILCFDTIVLNSPLEEEFSIEYLPDNYEIQRREFLRVDYRTTIEAYLTENDNFFIEVADISGGGLRFFSQKPIEPDSVIYFTLSLPYIRRTIDVNVQILDTPYLPQGEYAGVFVDLRSSDQDEIIKFCFKTHTEQARLFGHR